MIALLESSISILVHYILPATILLGILIFVHECGHCLVAKLVGVRVLKFSLGFGPKIFGKKIGETEYLLSLIPLGGYVKPLGEALDEPVSKEDRPFSLSHQTIPKRFAVLVAGSLFNILFAVVIFTCVYMIGTPMLIAKIGGVIEDTPAYAAGLKAGDLITSINGQKIELWEELSDIVTNSKGAELSMQVVRDTHTIVAQVTPQRTSGKDVFGETIQTYKIGIMASDAEDAVKIMRYNPAVAFWKGVQDTVKWSKLTVVALSMLIKSPVERRKDIGGPILIGKLAGDFAQVSIISFVLLMAMISVNLGVLNLLPIPILDGGHIFFLCIEALKGSPLSMRKMEIAQQLGLALLIMLMMFVFYNDITRIIPE